MAYTCLRSCRPLDGGVFSRTALTGIFELFEIATTKHGSLPTHTKCPASVRLGVATAPPPGGARGILRAFRAFRASAGCSTGRSQNPTAAAGSAMPRGKALSQPAVEHTRQRQCLSEGSGHTGQRQCLGDEGSRTNRAKAASRPQRQLKHKAKAVSQPRRQRNTQGKGSVLPAAVAEARGVDCALQHRAEGHQSMTGWVGAGAQGKGSGFLSRTCCPPRWWWRRVAAACRRGLYPWSRCCRRPGARPCCQGSRSGTS